MLLALTAACTTPLQQYEIKSQALSCDEANRVTYDTLKSMGFRITGFEPAKLGKPGFVKGVKQLSASPPRRQDGVVTIECTPGGVNLDAREEGKILGQVDMKRAFMIAYKSVLQMREAEQQMEAQVAAGTAPAAYQRKGLRVLLEPVPGHAAKLDFQFDMAAAGILPIRVTINNPTDRRYLLDVNEIRLTAADHQRVIALSPGIAAERITQARSADTGEPLTTMSPVMVADVLSGKLFRATRIDPHSDVNGYLFFPVGEYERARVVLTEEESGETEGFVVEF
jgi:hypothetical protein